MEYPVSQFWKHENKEYGLVNTDNEIFLNFETLGFLFGNDVLRLFHGNDECLTIPENWSEHPQHK